MIVIVGGGLAGCLAALRIRDRQPSTPLLLLDGSTDPAPAPRTWSFHSTDLSEGMRSWLSPMLRGNWTRHSVEFPDRKRNLEGGYHSLSSENLLNQTHEILGDSFRIGVQVTALDARSVTLSSGERIDARLVLDARGWSKMESVPCGYQKFVGMDVRLEEPHGLPGPILMDATCEQRDGYRFFYVLPWSETELLVEDTRYSDTPDIDDAEFDSEIHQYASTRGWKVAEIQRRERAALPIPLEVLNPPQALKAWSTGQAIPIGTAAGLFHPTTGYSIFWAARVAEMLGQADLSDPNGVARRISQFQTTQRAHSRYLLLLNRMLFRAAEPTQRYRVFQHFYRLPEATIARFYRDELLWSDQLRILSGRPPVPIFRAAKALALKPGFFQLQNMSPPSA